LALEPWERAVLRNFMDANGRLKSIPARHKKRMVILRWLADHFKPAVKYPEKQVNEIIARYHPDVASLRRWMVDEELMQRTPGVYWRAGTVSSPFSGEVAPEAPVGWTPRR
jgi:hypothetical protein